MRKNKTTKRIKNGNKMEKQKMKRLKYYYFTVDKWKYALYNQYTEQMFYWPIFNDVLLFGGAFL